MLAYSWLFCVSCREIHSCGTHTVVPGTGLHRLVRFGGFSVKLQPFNFPIMVVSPALSFSLSFWPAWSVRTLAVHPDLQRLFFVAKCVLS